MIKYNCQKKMNETALEEWWFVCFYSTDLPYIMILENQHKIRHGHNGKFRKTNFPKEVTNCFILKALENVEQWVF